jgi:hypothetical protein
LDIKSANTIINVVVGIFVVIGMIWAALHNILVVPKKQKIEHLEDRIIEIEGQKSVLEERLSKYKEYNGESNTILPPTWIPMNGAVRIFGGQGLLTLWGTVESKEGGLQNANLWISLPGSSFERNEGVKGNSIRIDMNGGDRVLFKYKEKQYALDSLGGELKKAQFAITALDIKEKNDNIGVKSALDP